MHIIKPDILETIQREGVQLHQRGKTFWTKCPLHLEKTPSFKVDPEKQLFFCFGCRQGGDTIALIMKLYNLDFQEACKYLGIDHKRKPLTNEEKAQIIQQNEDQNLLKNFKEWKKNRLLTLGKLLSQSDNILKNSKPVSDSEHWQIAEIQKNYPHWEYQWQILFDDCEEEQFYLYANLKKKLSLIGQTSVSAQSMITKGHGNDHRKF